jgi:hypothetical protein
MKTSINLALGTPVVKRKSYLRYGYWIFAVVLTVAVIMIAVTLGLKLQHGNLENQEQELLTAINSQADKKLQMLIVAERSQSIQSLFNRRGNLDKKLSELVAIFPSSIAIDTLNAQDSQFTVSLRTANLAELNTILEEDLPTFTQDNPEIKIVDISSFKASQGEYKLELRFEYKGGTEDE